MGDFCIFKRKTAYEMRISDWSSDVCSSDLFVYTENLTHSNPKPPEATVDALAVPTAPKLPPMEAVSIIKAALNRLDDIDGWYALGGVGLQLLAEMPDFDPRSYGCPKLSQLVEKCGAFDVRRENLMVYICPK